MIVIVCGMGRTGKTYFTNYKIQDEIKDYDSTLGTQIIYGGLGNTNTTLSLTKNVIIESQTLKELKQSVKDKCDVFVFTNWDESFLNELPNNFQKHLSAARMIRKDDVNSFLIYYPKKNRSELATTKTN